MPPWGEASGYVCRTRKATAYQKQQENVLPILSWLIVFHCFPAMKSCVITMFLVIKEQLNYPKCVLHNSETIKQVDQWNNRISMKLPAFWAISVLLLILIGYIIYYVVLFCLVNLATGIILYKTIIHLLLIGNHN